MTEAQIKHMVSRFLQWKLPESFSPDGGVGFTPSFKEEPMRSRHWPVGTNVLDAVQAEAMVRHMMEGMPSGDAYDQGRRDALNAILALNPKVSQRLHVISGGTEDTFSNHEGKLPFDVVFWVTEVAAQLGIEPKDDQP